VPDTQGLECFRNGIIGNDLHMVRNGRSIPVIYADWTASGRQYRPIEDFMRDRIAPYCANTHTETTTTGTAMTRAYAQARQIIREHVNAAPDDALVCVGSGMTAAVGKLQRLLGLRIPEKWHDRIDIAEGEKPVIFITHMEHHSNQTTWEECAATVRIIPANADGQPDLDALQALLHDYRERPMKIASVTACSNVTGIKTDCGDIAAIMHRNGGFCFVDFAAAAPYVDIDMHPGDPERKLDAIMFSPHKFLGGPGSCGILVFNTALYTNRVPDHPGGGTVTWTNPWGQHAFIEDIEAREDGGTPGFLQAIRAALAIRVKQAMGVARMAQRESQLKDYLLDALGNDERIVILEGRQRQRLCIVSLYVPGIHHNLIVRLLNDRFGVQTRGGCACAGTYGHVLLQVDPQASERITSHIDQGDLSDKPGWVRISLHPTTTDGEARTVVQAMRAVIDNAGAWASDYRFNRATGEFDPLHPEPAPVELDEFEPACRQQSLPRTPA